VGHQGGFARLASSGDQADLFPGEMFEQSGINAAFNHASILARELLKSILIYLRRNGSAHAMKLLRCRHGAAAKDHSPLGDHAKDLLFGLIRCGSVARFHPSLRQVLDDILCRLLIPRDLMLVHLLPPEISF